MWRLETNRHRFAVKQLSHYSDLKDSGTIRHYNVAETIAETFASLGIPAHSALRANSDYLQIIDETGYLVYPWSDGVALARTQIEEEHALKIVRLLAGIHRADIVVSGVRKTRFNPSATEKIEPLLRRASAAKALSEKALTSHVQRFVAINEACEPAALVLRRRLVIGHGDMDQKNVLWDSAGNPKIIDWESARKLNPTYELINMGLDWGGISSNFDANLFGKILSAYRQTGAIIDPEFLQPSFDCIMADWLTWLLYIIAVYLDKDDPQQRAIKAEQIDFILPTILRLERLAPELLDMARGIADG
jgi:Ser/Thr protein kinase RdoA (MazF antagonist)